MLTGWGYPLVFVAITIGVDYSNAKTTYRLNFGGLRCQLTQGIALLTYLGLPIAISIMLNILLHTNIYKPLWSICRLGKPSKMNNNFIVCVRLFVLMGFSWIFGFLSAFTDEVAIDFVFVILTSLQGVFLFVSFICNKCILHKLKKKIDMGKASNDKSVAKRDISQDPHERDPSEHSSENMHETEENRRKLTKKREKGKHEKEFIIEKNKTKGTNESTAKAETAKARKALMPNLLRSRELVKDHIFSDIRRNLGKMAWTSTRQREKVLCRFIQMICR